MEKNTYKLERLVDDSALREFCDRGQSDLLLVADYDAESKAKVLPPDAGDFAKWLRANTQHQIEVEKPDYRRMLHSCDIWLPLVFLAHECGLPVFLNLVSSYVYERMKGAIKGDQ